MLWVYCYVMWHIFDVDQVKRGFTILEIIRPYMFLSTGETLFSETHVWFSRFNSLKLAEVAKVGQQMMIQKKDKLLELVQLEVALGVCVHCYVL